MPTSRHVYIYEDVENNLKSIENVSALINEVLREYFKKSGIKSMSLEEKERRLEILRVEAEALQKIEEIKNVGN